MQDTSDARWRQFSAYCGRRQCSYAILDFAHNRQGATGFSWIPLGALAEEGSMRESIIKAAGPHKICGTGPVKEETTKLGRNRVRSWHRQEG